MTTKIKYICDICKREYSTIEIAQECEAKGKVSKDTYPIGLMNGNLGDDFYHRMSFAVADLDIEGHYATASLWACRDTGVGDSLGKQLCGNGNSYQPTPFDPRWIELNHFKRLKKYLKDNGIVPTVWVNDKAIPLSQALLDLRKKE